MRWIFQNLLLLSLWFCVGCSSQIPVPKEGIYYFKNVSTDKIPSQPTDEVSEAQARRLEVYYEAYFIDNKLFKLDKYVGGQRDWAEVYKYWEGSNKIKSREILHYTPGATPVPTQNFDPSGNLIK